MNYRTAVIFGLLAVVLSAPVRAQLRYIAFGDSITFGVGDTNEKGYPFRLRRILEKSQSEEVQVVKSGVPGEETSEALSRINSALAGGGDAIFLMEGTNDVTRIDEGVLSMETVIANLDSLALSAKRRGVEPIHATIIPRSPKALRDRNNNLTLELVRNIRGLAADRRRRFVDVFHAYDPELVEDFYDLYYFAGYDPIGHPNEEGYKLIAQTFADVLLGVDTMPPVVGPFSPGTLPTEIPPDIEFRVPIYEPSGAAGIDQKLTTLLINGQPVGETEGNRRSLDLVFQDEEAIRCRVVLAYRTEDRATPPNVAERILDIYNVTDRTVLPGDVDFDCDVHGLDLGALGWGFGAEIGDERYQRRLDLNADGVIDKRDLKILEKNFGLSSL
jgi:lysophospholipase L1-like esterase